MLFRNIKIKIYDTIILPAVLYRCETWFFILREENRLIAFEKMALRIFGGKRSEIVGSSR
jgi:hypothetical protein